MNRQSRFFPGLALAGIALTLPFLTACKKDERKVIVAVQAGAASTMAREQGFEDAIHKDFPGIEIVDKRYGEADFAKSLRAAENMLTAHPDLVGMFASNESSTVGADQALKGRKSG